MHIQEVQKHAENFLAQTKSSSSTTPTPIKISGIWSDFGKWELFSTPSVRYDYDNLVEG